MNRPVRIKSYVVDLNGVFYIVDFHLIIYLCIQFVLIEYTRCRFDIIAISTKRLI